MSTSQVLFGTEGRGVIFAHARYLQYAWLAVHQPASPSKSATAKAHVCQADRRTRKVCECSHQFHRNFFRTKSSVCPPKRRRLRLSAGAGMNFSHQGFNSVRGEVISIRARIKTKVNELVIAFWHSDQTLALAQRWTGSVFATAAASNDESR